MKPEDESRATRMIEEGLESGNYSLVDSWAKSIFANARENFFGSLVVPLIELVGHVELTYRNNQRKSHG